MQAFKPKTEFDFVQAVTMPFRSVDGKRFAWRLWFWVSLWLSILYIVFIPFLLPFIGEIATINWETMQAVQNQTPQPDPSRIIELFRKAWLPMFIFNLLIWMIYASAGAALNRKIINGREHSRLPLRFGKVELEVMAAQFSVMFFIFSLYVIGITLIVVIATSLGGLSPMLGSLFLIAGFLLIFCAVVYLFVRLAPASALTVATGEIRVLSARFVTKYRFWYLLLAYLVVFVGGYLIVNFVNNLLLNLVTGESGSMLLISGMSVENPQVALDAIAERIKRPSIMALGVICIIAASTIISLWWLCLIGVGTYAVKWWHTDNPEQSYN